MATATTLLGVSSASDQVHLRRPRRLGSPRVGPSRRGTAIRPLDHAIRVLLAQRRHESTRRTRADSRREWRARTPSERTLALENSKTAGFGAAGTMRPWGADVDALFTLGSRGGLMPFVFAGDRDVRVRQRQFQCVTQQLELRRGCVPSTRRRARCVRRSAVAHVALRASDGDARSIADQRVSRRTLVPCRRLVVGRQRASVRAIVGST